MTVEAHYVAGGLGSLVCETVAEHNLDCRVLRCGVREKPDGVVGSQQFLHHLHGLASEALVESALQALQVREVTRR
jgi:transketolase C-terminal domain/subunit